MFFDQNFYWAFSFRIKIFNQVIKFASHIVFKEFVKEAIMPIWIKSFLEINEAGVKVTFRHLFHVFVDKGSSTENVIMCTMTWQKAN